MLLWRFWIRHRRELSGRSCTRDRLGNGPAIGVLPSYLGWSIHKCKPETETQHPTPEIGCPPELQGVEDDRYKYPRIRSTCEGFRQHLGLRRLHGRRR